MGLFIHPVITDQYTETTRYNVFSIQGVLLVTLTHQQSSMAVSAILVYIRCLTTRTSVTYEKMRKQASKRNIRTDSHYPIIVVFVEGSPPLLLYNT